MDQQPDHTAQRRRSFQLNAPTVVCLLYAVAYFTVFSALVGVVLAYVWRNEPGEDWERSHYLYLIRTFWMGVLGLACGLTVAGALILGNASDGHEPDTAVVLAVMALVVLGFALLALLAVRCALSLVNAQKNLPMPRPRTWLA